MSVTSHRPHGRISQTAIGDVTRPVVCVAAVLLAAVMLVAGLVAAVASGGARQVIVYRFPAGTLGWHGAAAIMLDNARLALAPIAAAYLIGVIRPAAAGRWSGWRRAVRSGCDAMLMGRHTYESSARIWPLRSDPWAVRLNAMRKYVFSSKLSAAE